MNWNVGQKLVCVNTFCKHEDCIMPKINEVVTFNGFSPIFTDSIYLVEYPTGRTGQKQSIKADQFRPLLGQSAKSELINSFVEIVETSDCPIKTPEPC